MMGIVGDGLLLEFLFYFWYKYKEDRLIKIMKFR